TNTLRRKRLLLYISRRKPCKYLLFIQLGILALLIGFFIPAMLLLNKLRKQLATVKVEYKIYQNYVGSITLSHCQYMYPENYNNDAMFGFLAQVIVINGGAVRIFWNSQYEFSTRLMISLISMSRWELIRNLIQKILFHIPCHEKPAQCNRKIQMRQCPGVNGISLPRNLSITSLNTVKVPVLNISTIKGKTISALEIFAQLETVREGWPEQYRICDSEVLSEDTNCDPYDS
ncbi:hypothetical protein X798_06602, partial [Onchocerca flexuosa]